MPSKKNSSSAIIWHNSLVKSRSNLHQDSWEKQKFVCALPPLENLHQESFSILYFFFHPPTYRETPMATTIRAHIYTRGEVSFAKFVFLSSWFAKLLEAKFSCFAKIRWMPSWFVKLLKLLLLVTRCMPVRCYRHPIIYKATHKFTIKISQLKASHPNNDLKLSAQFDTLIW
jgi:hypothetical protein